MPDTTGSEPLIEIEGLYKLFGDDPQRVMSRVRSGASKQQILVDTGHTLGLRDINLQIAKGEIFVVMGLSGCGKSTLIRHFNRLIEPTEGRIRIEGIDVMGLSSRELVQFRRHRMSMVFQRFGLMPHRTVIENVGYGLGIQGMDRAARRREAARWLDAVGLDGYQDQYPSQLSGGQQQRVGLARALCTDTGILLMDEAFSALDPLIRSEMQDQLIALQERLHKTIVFITHDLDEALRLGDRIAILRDGELVQVGEPVDILLHPADDYVEAFVKDVNRARALTVATVMQAPKNRLTARTIGEALAQMRTFPADYGYYVNEEGYQGMVRQQALEQAVEQGAEGRLNRNLIEELPVISPDALIETVIPDTLDTDYPLPVVDARGGLRGALSRAKLAEVLGVGSGRHPAPA